MLFNKGPRIGVSLQGCKSHGDDATNRRTVIEDDHFIVFCPSQHLVLIVPGNRADHYLGYALGALGLFTYKDCMLKINKVGQSFSPHLFGDLSGEGDSGCPFPGIEVVHECFNTPHLIEGCYGVLILLFSFGKVALGISLLMVSTKERKRSRVYLRFIRPRIRVFPLCMGMCRCLAT